MWTGYSPKYHVGVKCFGLFCWDTQDKNSWRLLINPDLPEKINQSVKT